MTQGMEVSAAFLEEMKEPFGSGGTLERSHRARGFK